jgi:hypothetical protein
VLRSILEDHRQLFGCFDLLSPVLGLRCQPFGFAFSVYFSTAAGATQGGGNRGSKNYADGLEMSGPGGA